MAASTTDPPHPSHKEEGKLNRGKMLTAIVESLAKSRENESWGLMVEAAEDYQK